MTTTAVLFDLDDTLFDHRHCTREALAAVRAGHPCLQGRPLDDLMAAHSRILEALHLEVLAGRLSVDDARVRRFQTLLRESGEELQDADSLALARAYRETYLTHWRLVDGTLPLLRLLRDRHGVKIGLVTNNVVSEQERKVEALGLVPFTDALVISEAVGVNKPDPRIFQIALERLSARADGCVMVGDSWASDVVGATAAGIRAVWFNPRATPRPAGDARTVRELRSWEPPETAADLILNG